ncbi:MAG: hypothetical protein LIO54_01645 [Oscillospiraceae bacterium]|nr:hypothetical protein [Oscillospiraceae bacterium]
MTNEEARRTLARFAEVWRRAAPDTNGRAAENGAARMTEDARSCVSDGSEARTLAALIGQEYRAEQRFTALAAQTGGRAAETLLRLAAGCRGLVRQLQTEYFLLTGDSCPPPREAPPTDGLPAGLRRAWEETLSAERAYLAAAADFRDERAARCAAAARQKRSARLALRELAGRLLH